MQDKRTAHIVYTTYIQTHPILKGRRGPPFKNDALLNFVWFLLLSIERFLECSNALALIFFTGLYFLFSSGIQHHHLNSWHK